MPILPAHAAPSLQQMANAVRVLAMDMVNAAGSGHPGAPMGQADLLTVLFRHFLNYDPLEPDWPGRDRLILSGGHASAGLYAALHLAGYDIPLEELQNFRKKGSTTPGHPEYGLTPGVEVSTGPLGQGLGAAVGMALAAQKRAADVGADAVAPQDPRAPLFSHKVYCIVGDGDLMEGLSHEAAELAGHLQLSNLVVLWDDNGVSIDGPTLLSTSTDIRKRFEAYGFATARADGHDVASLFNALTKAQQNSGGQNGGPQNGGGKPVFIQVSTRIGYGSPNVGGTAEAHGKPLGEAEAKRVRKTLAWDEAPFDIPDEVYQVWREAASHGKRNKPAWQQAFSTLGAAQQDDLAALWAPRTPFLNGRGEEAQPRCGGPAEGANKTSDTLGAVPAEAGTSAAPPLAPLPEKAARALAKLKEEATLTPTSMATRKASGKVLEVVAPHMPALLCGAADLSPSVNTHPPSLAPLTPRCKGGAYLHYGVREHGMGAVMNGLALEGFRPVGGTFLAFADYLKPALRLACLMRLPAIYVFTHDSLAVGRDGPTHQPVEQIAMLRNTPGLTVLRPADMVETAECWELALAHTGGPVALVLSRQNTLPVRTRREKENLCARGAYVVEDTSEKTPDAVLLASGAEVGLAVQAARKLAEGKAADRRAVRVVSVPNWAAVAGAFDCAPHHAPNAPALLSREAFEKLAPAAIPRVAVEAAPPIMWQGFVGGAGGDTPAGAVVGVRHFGLCASGEEALAYAGLTVDAVVDAVKKVTQN